MRVHARTHAASLNQRISRVHATLLNIPDGGHNFGTIRGKDMARITRPYIHLCNPEPLAAGPGGCRGFSTHVPRPLPRCDRHRLTLSHSFALSLFLPFSVSRRPRGCKNI